MEKESLQVNIYLLGRPRISIDDQPLLMANRKALTLVAYLLLHNGSQSRDKLATLLWPEYNQTRARANLRRVIWILNQTPLADFFEAGKDELHLPPQEGLWADALSIQEELANWRSRPAGERAETNMAQLDAAIDLYHRKTTS